MWVEDREIELAGDEEQHGSHGFEAGVPARLALGSLKQAVDGFNEAIGLARLGPRDDAVEMTKDHACDVLHGLDLGMHDAGAPPAQHLGEHIDLLAIENLAQLLSVHSGTGAAVGGVLADQRLEIGQLREVQLVYVRDDHRAGSKEPAAVWFAYSPNRQGVHPQRHLAGFKGILQADAYAGFNDLFRDTAP